MKMTALAREFIWLPNIEAAVIFSGELFITVHAAEFLGNDLAYVHKLIRFDSSDELLSSVDNLNFQNL
jgi:hypothetical protein